MITSFPNMTTSVINSHCSSDDQKVKQAMQKSSSRSKFSIAEDEQLRSLVSEMGEHNWHSISIRMPGRSTRQCRERWVNYLSPTLNNSNWTSEEDQLLIEKQAELGTKWVEIAKLFPNRTDRMVKNRFHVLQRSEIRADNLQKSCDPLLMMMVLNVCGPNSNRNENPSMMEQSKPSSIIEPISQVEIEFDQWSETMNYEFFDF
jgi:hypothetical protein